MKRAHRRTHLFMWLTIAPVTIIMFFLSLYYQQPDPQVSDDVIDLIRQEAE